MSLPVPPKKDNFRFDDWMFQLWKALNGTLSVATGYTYSPGSFRVLTGSFLLMANHLILTGTQRATLQGTARLRLT